ncbi:helix-turn-helix domain-containing protein [Myxococcota bacterium]|nr:helix-turn-helix domain-containing protein [Myxococcota bacterium]
MNSSPYELITMKQVEEGLASRMRALRLAANWKQTTLALRSGVSLGSLRRFEATGRISLQNLLRLAWALGRLEEFMALFESPEITSLRELEQQSKEPHRKRGMA